VYLKINVERRTLTNFNEAKGNEEKDARRDLKDED
jgi:hypothetical protein